MRACVWAAAHVLRGWPPPRRVCRALLLMTKFDLLQRIVGALGAVASIRWGAGRLSLDVGPWGPGQALVGVDPWDGGVSGVRRRGPGRSLSGFPFECALKACQWRGVLWGLSAIPGCEWHVGKSRADLSGMGRSWVRVLCTFTGSSSSVRLVFSVKAAGVRAAAV